MKRVRAHALAMVNWKGVFYERYLLDPHVTALEGANGSGKTTVLIGAYMVLLPDLSRLRFTNLGESAATGGDRGIYGRLGEPGRPTYAVLDIRLPRSERLLAGVHLERRSEPNLDVTTFMVTGLSADVALQDVLLDRGEVDEVPELARLRELAAFNGGRLVTFDTLKDYFAALFDRGVTPMRLATDDERIKFNDMLRTSMVGGISKALSDGLRGFLLKEETGLADTLKRMRGNLDACRRTRRQVDEATDLERDIHGVYEAGQTMFAAALHATRERERESREKRDAARASWEAAQAGLEDEEARLAEARHRQEAAHADLLDAGGTLDRARAELEVTRRAHAIRSRILVLEGRHAERIPRHEAARLEVARARDRVEEATASLEGARDRLEDAARGLSDWRAGLENLERDAYLHEEVVRRLESARAEEAAGGWGHPEIPAGDLPWNPEGIADRLARSREQREACDRALARGERDVAVAEERRREFAHALAALVEITGTPCDPGEALAHARAALREKKHLERRADREPDLRDALRAASRQAHGQAAAREAAALLSREGDPLATQAAVQDAHARAGGEVEALHEARRQCEHAESRAREQEARATARLAELHGIAQRRGRVVAAMAHLEHRHARPLGGRADLLALQEEILAQRVDLEGQKRAAEQRRDALAEEARRLEQSGGTFPEALLDARDRVEGELLAGRFEEATVEEAARIQALLGPLAEAIVVEDVREAARRLAGEEDGPGTVWLLDAGEGLALGPGGVPRGEMLGGSALVPLSPGSRLTRLPARPTLGRRAREARIDQVNAEEARASDHVVDLSARLRPLPDALAEVANLLPDVAVLDLPDPAPEIERVADDGARAGEAMSRAREQGGELKRRLAEATRRQADLGRLLASAHLLDLPDQAAEAERLGADLEASRRARVRLEAIRDAALRLEESLDVLRQPPPDEAGIARMREEAEATGRLRDRLEGRIRDLDFVRLHHHALAFTDARRVLAEQQTHAPALERRLAQAREDEARGREAQRRAEEARDAAVGALQKEEAGLHDVEATLERERLELAETGCADASDAGLRGAEARHREAEGALGRVVAEERRCSEACVRLEERTRHLRETARERHLEAEAAEGAWRPDHERWERLQAQADKAGMLAAALADRFTGQFARQGNVALWTQASASLGLLLERLERSHDGADMAADIRGRLGAESEQQRGELYLEGWMRLQDWVRRRVPANIAQADDPLERLEQLRSHLARLRDNLGEQERRLRGQSADVARHIETQIRKARSTVGRLCQELSRVRFGSIHAVRISALPVQRMEQALRALRDGAAQQLLFEADMPVEEAMAELFRRYGGGRDGGDRLLDYREYIKLQVDVRRGATSPTSPRARRRPAVDAFALEDGEGSEAGDGWGSEARGDWEEANPVRMSTGEAMGVGAAVMMVVLAAWERDARLFRGATQAGTLRILFLDEATRLSQDNLGVLFELCRNLELQLLIAAPEVARGEGTTTYRLVRHIDAQGREEVLVTGRRFVTDALASGASAAGRA